MMMIAAAMHALVGKVYSFSILRFVWQEMHEVTTESALRYKKGGKVWYATI